MKAVTNKSLPCSVNSRPSQSPWSKWTWPMNLTVPMIGSGLKNNLTLDPIWIVGGRDAAFLWKWIHLKKVSLEIKNQFSGKDQRLCRTRIEVGLDGGGSKRKVTREALHVSAGAWVHRSDKAGVEALLNKRRWVARTGSRSPVDCVLLKRFLLECLFMQREEGWKFESDECFIRYDFLQCGEFFCFHTSLK